MKRLAAVIVVLLGLTHMAAAQWRPGGTMRIVLLVDSSARVAPMVTPMRAALNAFVDELPGDPEITFITTGGQIRIRVPPTSEREKVKDAVGRFASDGGANSFVDTLLESDRRFLRKTVDKRPVFVIVTTDSGAGTGEQRIAAYNEFAQSFVSRGGRAHAIVIREGRSGVTSIIAENLTENSGGFLETINLASALPKAMKTLLSYVAADQ